MAVSESQDKVIRFVSLFSGAMGLDIGLEYEGFETAICVENDVDAINTIKANKPNVPVLGDIREITGDNIRKESNLKGEIPLVAGGPPCQAFSICGNRNGLNDSRGKLIFEFIRIVDELRPQIFLMENVRGLLSMPVLPKGVDLKGMDERDFHEKGSLLRLIFRKFENLGYRADCFVVNAANYGAPQIRERLIIIGNRYNLVAKFPEPQFSNRPKDRLPPFRTLGDAIGNQFTDTYPELMNFSPRKLHYLSLIPEGGNWRSLPVDIQRESMGKSWHLKGGRSAYWRKLSYAFPSPTLVTMPNHASTSMCHPKELRAITVGEAAAIQEFPANWKFSGTTASKYRQIGNAVPIRLGMVSGKVIKELLNKIDDSADNANSIPSRIEHIRPHVRTRTFWKEGKSFSGDKSYYEEEFQTKLTI